MLPTHATQVAATVLSWGLWWRLTQHLRLYGYLEKSLLITVPMPSKEIKSCELAETWHFNSQPCLLPTGNKHYCERSLQSLLCSSHSVHWRWPKHIWNVRTNKLQQGLLQTNINNLFTAIKTPWIINAQNGSPSPPPSWIFQGRVHSLSLAKVQMCC